MSDTVPCACRAFQIDEEAIRHAGATHTVFRCWRDADNSTIAAVKVQFGEGFACPACGSKDLNASADNCEDCMQLARMFGMRGGRVE